MSEAIAKITRCIERCERDRARWKECEHPNYVLLNDGMIKAYQHCLEMLGEAEADNALEKSYDLLKRIMQWDHLASTSDGAYWRLQIGQVLAAAPMSESNEASHESTK